MNTAQAHNGTNEQITELMMKFFGLFLLFTWKIRTYFLNNQN